MGKEGATFKCTVAVYPEVELGQYKGLEAVKAEVKVCLLYTSACALWPGYPRAGSSAAD